MSTGANQIIRDGLWHNNPALVQLLGLCPLLAVTNTVVNAIGLGLATLMVVTGSNMAVSLIRNRVTDSMRLPAFVMIIAALVTCTELIMQAYAYRLYQILGIFIPLIVTNCAILGRAEAFASRNPLPKATLDGLMTGLGFLAVLVLLGGMRELVGYGTLLADAHLLFGEAARGWTLTVFPDYRQALIAVLPPGAFIGLGLIIALRNRIDHHIQQQQQARQTPVESGHKRVRVTGTFS
ncbi:MULTISPECIES: electron transport complex subunit E [Halomonadaceae]|uniref:Ion-translocating oxidoreductase complex subunit E n=1 Tax=Vreelandella halophila TaxID=86177 RepID=A0A9X4YAD9_9GAMM|nr:MULTISPECIES: electron transport complex subunit E [Halomonas]MYL25668.1 RnfABCDGE type electron transport complex subunit E [Halomonas utahensis]MYL76173.1 RnfABCDGE type electron transport complex subunit E [Halomonas sp. 22501_18_FS]